VILSFPFRSFALIFVIIRSCFDFFKEKFRNRVCGYPTQIRMDALGVQVRGFTWASQKGDVGNPKSPFPQLHAAAYALLYFKDQIHDTSLLRAGTVRTVVGLNAQIIDVIMSHICMSAQEHFIANS
jgi:hypothetical protein